MRKPVPQEIYRHFKGKLYQILTIAKHSETGEELVIYQALYGDFAVYARPLTMFMSPVDKVKYPDATQELRFEPVKPTEQAEAQEEIGGESNAAVKESAPVKTVKKLSREEAFEQFMDTHSSEKKLELLEYLREGLTEDMLELMAISCDIVLNEDSLEERYRSLKKALILRDKYETTRLR